MTGWGLLVGVALFSSGCAQSMPWGRVGMLRRAEPLPPRVDNTGAVEGQACGVMVMGRVQEAALLSRAMRAALRRAGPDVKALEDVTVEAAGSELVLAGYPVVVRRCLLVRGKPALEASGQPAREESGTRAGNGRPPPAREQGAVEGIPDAFRLALLGQGAMHPEVESRYLRVLLVSALLAPVGGHLWGARIFYPDVDDATATHVGRIAALVGVLLPLGHCLLLPLPLLCAPSLVVLPVGIVFMAAAFSGSQVAWLALEMMLEWLVLPRAVGLAYSGALDARDDELDRVMPAEPPAEEAVP